MTDINRRLHEALGKCWHEFEEKSYEEWNVIVCQKCKFEANGLEVQFPEYWNLDYCADPRLVIEAMMEREDWKEFTKMAGWWTIGSYPIDQQPYTTYYLNIDLIMNKTYYLNIDLIMDKTGRLAQWALAWLEKENDICPDCLRCNVCPIHGKDSED